MKKGCHRKRTARARQGTRKRHHFLTVSWPLFLGPEIPPDSKSLPHQLLATTYPTLQTSSPLRQPSQTKLPQLCYMRLRLFHIRPKTIYYLPRPPAQAQASNSGTPSSSCPTPAPTADSISEPISQNLHLQNSSSSLTDQVFKIVCVASSMAESFPTSR